MNKITFHLVNIIELCICILILSSCGFFSLENSISSLDSSSTPHLSLRGSGDDPDLDCEGNTSCEYACEEIYEKSKSYTKCYDLSIGEVADLDKLLFHVLMRADTDELDDIDMDIFEEYLEIGLDGFIDRVIGTLDDDGADDKIENIFNWIIENEDVAEVLNSEDDDNDILKELLLARCNDDCSVSDTTINGTSIDIQNECVGGSDEDLFSALLINTDDNENFFLKAEEGNNIELFSLGHEILVEIFSYNNRTLEEECIRGFYCLLEDSDNTLADFFLNEDIQQYIGTIDTYTDGSKDILSCRQQNFSELP